MRGFSPAAASRFWASSRLPTWVPTHRALPLLVSGGVPAPNVGTFIQQGIAVAATGFDLLLPDNPARGEELLHLGTAAVSSMLASMREARPRFQPLLATAAREGRSDIMASIRWSVPSFE